MAIESVKQGDKITASLFNEVVDAVNGQDYSSGSFVNTARGAVFSSNHSEAPLYRRPTWPSLFQVSQAKYWKQTARGTWSNNEICSTVMIDLGAGKDALNKNISIRGKEIESSGLIVGDSASMDCEIDDDTFENASGDTSKWVDLGILSANFIAADLFQYQPEDEDEEVKYYFVVTDREESDSKQRATDLFQINSGELEILKRFYVSHKADAANGNIEMVQMHTGAISWSDPISSEALSGDSQILSSLLSSIQVVDISAEVSSEIEISGEISTVTGTVFNKGIQWYNFQEDNTPLSDVEVLSASVPIRRIPDGSQEVSANYYVDYVALSDILLSCDADNDHILSSASITNKDHELRIYGFVKHDENFEETERKQYLNRDLKHNANIADIQLRVLSGGDSGEAHETEFISLYDVMEKHPDTSIEDAMSSLEYVELSTDAMSVDYMQLYKFNKKDYVILSTELPEKKNHLDIVLRDWTATSDKSKAQVSYLPLSCLSSANVSVDTTFPGSNTSSIVIAANDQGETYLMLKGFKDEETQQIMDVLSTATDYDFLVRHDDNGQKELQYVNLSAFLSSALSSLSVDSEFTEVSSMSSISFVDDKRDTLQLFKFKDLENRDLTYLKENLEKLEFVLRNRADQTGEQAAVDYTSLSALSALLTLSADSEVDLLKRFSIEKVGDNKDILELYNFASVDVAPLSITIGKDPKISDKDFQFLVRHNDKDNGRIALQYAQLCVDTGISVDTDLSDQFSIELNKDQDYYQLYKFDKVDEAPLSITFGTDSRMSDKDFQVLIRHKDTDNNKVVLEYAQLCVDNILSGDSQVDGVPLSSIQVDLDDNCMSFFKFDEDEYRMSGDDLSTAIKNKKLDFVIREHKDSGAEVVQYVRVNDILSSMSSQVSVDTGTPGSYTSSIVYELADEGECLAIKGFDGETCVPISEVSAKPEDYDVLVRHYVENAVNDSYEMKYVNISAMLSGISGDFRISGDSQIDDCDTSSIVSLSTDAGIALRVKGFDGQAALATSTVSANQANYDVLLRYKNGSNYDMQYVNVSGLLSCGTTVSCDSEGSTGYKSLDRNDNGELQLYNFDNANLQATVGFNSSGYTPTTHLFPIRTSDGQLKYSRIQYVPRTDTSCDYYSNSIELNTSYNSLMINGFRTKTNKTLSEVSANSSNYDVLMRRHNGSYYYTEYMNVAPLLSGGSSGGATKDLSVVTSVTWDTTNYRIKMRGVKMSFVNGLLSTVTDESDMSYIATTPWTGE